MKKFLALVLCLTLVLTCFTALFGCGPGFRTYTHGDWVIMHSAEGECKIFDLSEEGKQKEVLIFPTEVAGRKVTGTYYEKGGWYHYGHNIDAPNLKRLYFTEFVHLSIYAITTDRTKIFVLYDISDNTSGYLKENTCYINNLQEEEQGSDDTRPANVNYYYNYQNAPFDGLYWIDDYGDIYIVPDGCAGEIIKYPPENPTREGYEFMGWYKEPECINKWDFKADIVPRKVYEPELSINDGNNEIKEKYHYAETALYAGWNKIEE